MIVQPITPTTAALYFLAMAVFLCWHELRALRSRLGPRTVGQRFTIWQIRRQEERIKRLKSGTREASVRAWTLSNKPSGAKQPETVIGMRGDVIQTQRRPEKPRKL